MVLCCVTHQMLTEIWSDPLPGGVSTHLGIMKVGSDEGRCLSGSSTAAATLRHCWTFQRSQLQEQRSPTLGHFIQWLTWLASVHLSLQWTLQWTLAHFFHGRNSHQVYSGTGRREDASLLQHHPVWRQAGPQEATGTLETSDRFVDVGNSGCFWCCWNWRSSGRSSSCPPDSHLVPCSRPVSRPL